MRKYQNRIFMTRTVKAVIPWDLILFIETILLSINKKNQNTKKNIFLKFLLENASSSL